MNHPKWSKCDSIKHYFPVSNEVLLLGLSPEEYVERYRLPPYGEHCSSTKIRI